jgi:hypothetical protein
MSSHRRMEPIGPFAQLALSAVEGLRVTIALCVATPLVVSSTAAQVGHPPQSSPYRDIRKGHSFTVIGGYFKGDGGQFGIGPHGGAVFGVRYDIRTANTIQIGIGVARGNLERFIIDPFVIPANQRSGPVKQAVTFAELDLHFNLTGGKSWHRIAPYVATSGGIAFGERIPGDISGYNFGRKLYLAPGIGLRFFLSDRLHLRAEARAAFWKLKYPATFQQAPRDDPTAPPVLTGSTTEWVSSRWLQAGIGYSFSP